jgi:hypothetical protein
VAEPADRQLDRLLTVAALVRSVIGGRPVVVGGVAEVFWTRLPYHPTDLGICAPLDADGARRLIDAGFVREGRHWWHEEHGVAVEFPEPFADADPERFAESHGAVIIGVSDLYLDRLRQSTANDSRASVEYQSLMAVASSCIDIIEWPYVRRRIAAEPLHLRASMRRNQRAVRDAVRRAQGDGG